MCTEKVRIPYIEQSLILAIMRMMNLEVLIVEAILQLMCRAEPDDLWLQGLSLSELPKLRIFIIQDDEILLGLVQRDALLHLHIVLHRFMTVEMVRGDVGDAGYMRMEIHDGLELEGAHLEDRRRGIRRFQCFGRKRITDVSTYMRIVVGRFKDFTDQ